MIRRLHYDHIRTKVRSKQETQRADLVRLFWFATGQTQLRELLVRSEHHKLRTKHHPAKHNKQNNKLSQYYIVKWCQVKSESMNESMNESNLSTTIMHQIKIYIFTKFYSSVSENNCWKCFLFKAATKTNQETA